VTDRKTASTITDTELDALYRDLDAARRMLDPDDVRLVDEMTATVEKYMDRAARAEAEVARLRAGEEDGWDPACHPTPGQWIKRYNDATPEKRLDYVTRLTAAAEQGHNCGMSLHEERVQEGWEAKTAVVRVRALHRRNEHTGDCEHCSEHDYPDYAVPHPCATIRALDGQEQR
jgi:hypothetical protein